MGRSIDGGDGRYGRARQRTKQQDALAGRIGNDPGVRHKGVLRIAPPGIHVAVELSFPIVVDPVNLDLVFALVLELDFCCPVAVGGLDGFFGLAVFFR